jgi:CRISPR/Cas system-associated exonuclease Cas4 (RecB family)
MTQEELEKWEAQYGEAWHATEIQKYTWCPMAWWLREVGAHEETDVSPWLCYGSYGHYLLENASPGDREAASEILEEHGFVATDHDKQLGETEEKVHHFNRIFESMGGEFLEKEQQIGWGWDSHCFKSTIDAIVRFPDTLPGHVDMLDYKFGAAQGEEELRRNTQMMLYYMGLRAHKYKVNRIFWVDMGDFLPYRRDGKTAIKGELRGPGFKPIIMTDEQIPYAQSMVSAVIESMKSGLIYQAPYGFGMLAKQKCSRCAMKQHCPSLPPANTILV